jgi:hypothetical protein
VDVTIRKALEVPLPMQVVRKYLLRPANMPVWLLGCEMDFLLGSAFWCTTSLCLEEHCLNISWWALQSSMLPNFEVISSRYFLAAETKDGKN